MLDALKCIFLDSGEEPGNLSSSWGRIYMDFSGQAEPYIQMYFGQTQDKTTDKGETLGSCEDVSCEPETGSWHPVQLLEER